MAGPSLYPILLNRGATQPPDLYPLFMERDDLVPLRARIGLIFEADGFPPCPIVPVVDTDITQDRTELECDIAAAPAESITPVLDTDITQTRSELQFDLASEPQPDQTVRSVAETVKPSSRAVFRVKSRTRRFDA